MAASIAAPAPRIDDDIDAFSVAIVCRRASIGKTKLYEEIAAGRLRAVKIGVRTVVLRHDLQRWLAGLPALHADPNDRPVAGGRRRGASGSPGAAMPQGPIGAGAAGGGGATAHSAGRRDRSAAS